MVWNTSSSSLRKIIDSGRIAIASCLALVLSAQAAPKHGTTQNEFFDSAASAATNGWTGFNNDPIAGTGGAGGHIRFSNTNNTLGNPAGEAGGNLSRTDGTRAYYADTTIGGPSSLTLNVGDRMFASGEVYIQSGSPVADTQLIVGYFNRSLTNPANLDDFIGFRINEGANTVRANAFGGDYGGYNGSGGDAGAAKSAVFANGAYTWTFSYVPGGFTLLSGQFNYGEITVSLTPAGGGPTTTLRNALNPLQNRTTRTLDTFGLVSFNAGDADQTFTNTYFVDNLNYFVVPEPSVVGVAMGAVMCGAMLRWRGKRRG